MTSYFSNFFLPPIGATTPLHHFLCLKMLFLRNSTHLNARAWKRLVLACISHDFFVTLYLKNQRWCKDRAFLRYSFVRCSLFLRSLFVHPSFCLRSSFVFSLFPERRISLKTTVAQRQIFDSIAIYGRIWQSNQKSQKSVLWLIVTWNRLNLSKWLSAITW